MPVFTDKQKERVAMLAALCLFLSTLEYLFPRPLPFMRLGLANLPVILSLDLLPRGKKKTGTHPLTAYFVLILLKVLGQGMVNGTMASYVFLFSLCGSFASGLGMYLAWRFLAPHVSFLGIGVLGALLSNITQIFLSIAFIFGPSAWRILPLFLGIGLLSGIFIGLFAQNFSEKSVWWAQFREEKA